MDVEKHDPEGQADRFRLSMHPWKTPDGSIGGAMAFINPADRTGLKPPDDAPDSDYRALFNAVQDGISVHDPETGAILDVNPATCAMLGRSREELLRIDVSDASAAKVGQTQKDVERLVRRAAEGRPQIFEWVLLDKDGREVPIEANLKTVTLSGRRVVVAVTRDCSERKQAEQALVASEKRYRELYESSLDGYAMTTMDGTVLEANAAMLDLLGYTREELLGRNFRDITPARWHAMEERLLQEQLLDRGHTDGYEKEYIRRDGSIVPIEIRTYLAHDEHGNPGGMWAFVRDISERKRIQAEQTQQLERARRQQTAIINLSTDAAMVDGDWHAFRPLITRIAAEALAVDRVSLWLLDEEGFQFRCVNVFDRHASDGDDRPVFSLADAPAYLEAIMTQRTLGARDVADSILMDEILTGYFQPRGITSAVQAPIRTGGWPAGVLSCEHRGRPREWTHDEISFVAALADQASLALLSAERTVSAEALFENEQRFRTVADFTYDWEYWISPEGRMLYVSPSCRRISGYEREAFIQDPGLLVRIAHEDDRAAVELHLRNEPREATEDSLSFRIRTRSGQEKWVEHSCLPVHDASGRFLGRRASNRDVTERKHAEHALRESEERYRTLVETMSDGLAVIDHTGCITFASQRLADILDRPLGRIVGGTATDLFGQQGADMLAADTWDPAPCAERRFEIALPRSGTDPLHVAVDTRPYKEGPDGRSRLLLMVTDITEQKELQDRIARAEKMEMVGRLAGGVAHDLNNVLCGVVTYPDLMLMQLPDDDPHREMVQTVKRSGERAAAVVADLLTLARRGGRTEEVFDLNAVIKDYLRSPELESLRAEHPTVGIRHNLDPDLPGIRGSTVHFAKTVMNLVNNAVEAVGNDGQVTVTTSAVQLDADAAGRLGLEEGRHVRMDVADTGEGIPRELRQKIFEPFFSTKQTGRSGTGLGLSVVWGTVTDHHGAVDVDSTEGQGTTFTLLFPAVAEKPTDLAATPPGQTPWGQGQTVLVVDDQPAQRQIACETLRALGYRPSAVSSGDEAVEIVRDVSVDLVLLDMIMPPGPDGLDTYRNIRSARPDQKVVLMGGYAETQRVTEAQRLGAGAFIRKPYTVDQLAECLHATLHERGVP